MGNRMRITALKTTIVAIPFTGEENHNGSISRSTAFLHSQGQNASFDARGGNVRFGR